MKRIFSLLFILSTLIILLITPAYAATTVDGVSYPILISGGSSFYGINAQSIDQVDSFSITVNSSSTITYYVNLLTSSGSCRFGTSFSSDNVCRLTYNGVSEALSRSGYSITDLRGVLVNANTADSYSVLYDAVEKSSILTGLIRWLTDAFDSVRTALSNLGSGIVDFLTGALQGIVDNAIAVKDAIIEFLTGAIKGIVDNAISIKDSIVEFLTGVFDSVLELLTSLYDAIIGEIEATWALWTGLVERFVNLVVNLVSGLSDYLADPLGPINDFLNSLDSSAISIWLKFFDLPIVSDILKISIVLAILSGLIAFLITAG